MLQSSPYPNWVFSLFSGIGFVLCCIPFPWHLEAWNTGTCLVMAWSGLACLGLCIDSIIWKGNTIDWAPVWCDIFSRFLYSFDIGMSAASLCISRRLYLIVLVRKVIITRAEKRSQIAVDLAIGLIIPIIYMILHYINQIRRFFILEDVGCFYDNYSTWVGIVTYYVPLIIVGLISGIYAILSICTFCRVRAQSKEILSLHSNFTNGRYIRLIALAGIHVISSVPIHLFSMIDTICQGPEPWTSWGDIHADVSRVYQYPAQVWHLSYSWIEMTRWMCVAMAFVFFAFFGFSSEAMNHYRSAIRSVGKRVGVSAESFGSLSNPFLSSGIFKGSVGSHPGSITGFSKGKITHKGSSVFNIEESGSIDTSSIPIPKRRKWAPLASIISSKKKFNEEVFKPSFQYNDLVLPNINSTLPGDNVSAIHVPVAVSSISTPESTVMRPETVDVPVPTSISVDPRRHSPDIV